jgi:tetratricopeptide (TPR) repeat protein
MKYLYFVLALFFYHSYFSQTREIDSLKTLLKAPKDDTTKVTILSNLSKDYMYLDDFINAIEYSNESKILSERMGYKKGLVIALSDLGLIYKRFGQIEKALDSYFNALKISEGIKDKEHASIILNNIGVIYETQGSLEKALEFNTKAMKIMEEIGDEKSIGRLLINQGSVNLKIGNTQEAFMQFNKSYSLAEKNKNIKLLGIALASIGNYYKSIGNNSEAVNYFKKAHDEFKKVNNNRGISNILGYMSEISFNNKEYKNAETYAFGSFTFAKLSNSPEHLKNASEILYKVYKEEKKYKEALKTYEIYKIMSDSINNSQTQKEATKKQIQYEFQKKEVEIKAEQNQRDILTRAEIRQQKQQRNYFIIGFGIVLILSLFILRGYWQKRKANIAIENQKKIIELKQKEILGSIHYAKRIQSALMPREKQIETSIKRLKK